MKGRPGAEILRTVLWFTVLASCLDEHSRGAELDAPNQASAPAAQVDSKEESLTAFTDAYDPSLPDLAVWEASLLWCGADRAVQDVTLESEESTLAALNASQRARHHTDQIGIVTVDVMVLYTAEARLLRGQAGVEDTIQLCLSCANEALRRSQVPVELRLVHVAEARGCRESGKLSAAISWLTSDPMVQSLRDKYGADLVSLLVSRGDFSGLAACGRSHSVFTGHPVAFAHEIGHNFGCGHERGQPGQCCRDTFSYAYVFTPPDAGGHTYGTIMSYVGSVILNFSNPRVLFHGHPTGLPEGHRDLEGREDSADNARTLAAAAPEVAARRASPVTSLEFPRLDETGRTFSFEIAAGPQENLVVEYTSDFAHWTPLGQFEVGSGPVKVADAVESVGARFYRARGGSKAQVRAIGFYRRRVPAGYSLVANQLDHGDNRVNRLFPNLPVGTTLYKWDPSAHEFTENTRHSSGWNKPDMTLHPGEGAVLHTESPLVLSFVGYVRDACYLPMGTDWSLVSSSMPQPGGLTSTLGFPLGGVGQTGEIFKQTGSPPGYQSWSYADGSWWSTQEPRVEIGEAFWARASPNAYIWKRVLLPLDEPRVPEADPWIVEAVRSHASTVELMIRGEPGAVCQIEGSPDLTHWNVLATIALLSGGFSWTDPEVDSHRIMFYRATRIRP